MTNTENRSSAFSYFGNIIKKYTVFAPFLIAMALLTLYYFIDINNYFSIVTNLAPTTQYMIYALFGVVVFAYAVLLFSKFRSKTVYVADLIVVSFFLFILGYIILTLFRGVTLKNATPIYILYPIDIFLLVFRMVCYTKGETDDGLSPTLITAYFGGVRKRYSLTLTIFASLIIFFCMKLFDVNGVIYLIKYYLTQNIIFEISVYVVCALSLLYVISVLFRKIITVFDFFLNVGFIDLLIFLAYIHIYGTTNFKTIAYLIALGVILLFILIRMNCFNRNRNTDFYSTKTIGNESKGFKAYIKEYFKRVNILLPIIISISLVLASVVFFERGIIERVPDYNLTAKLYILGFFGILASFVVVSFIIALFKLNSKKVGYQDFALYTLLLTSIFGLITYKFILNYISLYALIAMAVCVLFLIIYAIIRISLVRIYDGKVTK